MGAWGTKLWDSDDAADWFGSAFAGADIDKAIEEAYRYDDTFNAVRSVCYVLTVLGHSPYTWPGDLDRLDAHKTKGLKALRAMAEEGSEFRMEWDNNPKVLAELKAEIVALEAITGAGS